MVLREVWRKPLGTIGRASAGIAGRWHKEGVVHGGSGFGKVLGQVPLILEVCHVPPGETGTFHLRSISLIMTMLAHHA